jgi:hypothetical protein
MSCTKVQIVAVFSVLFSSFAFTGCDKNSGPTNTGPQNDLVGIWNLSTMTSDGQTQTPTDMGMQSIVLTITSGSKYSVVLTTVTATATTQQGTYTTSGNQIAFTDTTGLVSSGSYILSGSNVTFTLTNSVLGDYTQIFVRQ